MSTPINAAESVHRVFIKAFAVGNHGQTGLQAWTTILDVCGGLRTAD